MNKWYELHTRLVDLLALLDSVSAKDDEARDVLDYLEDALGDSLLLVEMICGNTGEN